MHGQTMTDTAEKIDYSKTLYLPQTDFPMRAVCRRKSRNW
jgi:isoleucyl-tRNA synthetase